MLVCAARGVPLGRVGTAAALVVLLVELVRWDAWLLWPLQGTAVGLLGGAAAWCFDEVAAAVVDVAPRGLGWRSAARAPVVLALLTVWTATVWHAGDGALFGHRDAVLVQGFAAVAACSALALRSRARGEATPGVRIAAVVVPVCTAWALVRPWPGRVPVFPYGDSSTAAWQLSSTGWTALAGVALAGVAVVLGEVLRHPRFARRWGLAASPRSSRTIPR